MAAHAVATARAAEARDTVCVRRPLITLEVTLPAIRPAPVGSTATRTQSRAPVTVFDPLSKGRAPKLSLRSSAAGPCNSSHAAKEPVGNPLDIRGFAGSLRELFL